VTGLFDEREQLRVGAVTLLLLVAAAAALVLRAGRVAGRPVVATAYFTEIGSLSPGADVQVAGAPIGSVARLTLVPARLSARPDHPLVGQPGVAVTLHIDPDAVARLPLGSQLFIANKGLFGESYIEIGPPRLETGRGRPVRSGDELRGIDPVRLDRVLRRLTQLGEDPVLASLFHDLRALVAELEALGATLRASEPAPGAYRGTLAAFEALGRELAPLRQHALPAVGRGLQLWTRSSALLEHVDGRLAAVAPHVAALELWWSDTRTRVPPRLRERALAALGQLRSAQGRLRRLTDNVRAQIAAVRAGQGTIARLLGDPEFFDEAKELGKILKRQPWRLIGRPDQP
jgi:ABC-type transporter Mla subunit MlaD